MTVKDKENILHELLKNYNSMQNEMDMTIKRASEVLNLPIEKTKELFNLMTFILEDDNLEALSNIRILVEAIKPLFEVF